MKIVGGTGKIPYHYSYSLSAVDRLHVDKTSVMAVEREKFIMRATLHDLAAAHHADHVGIGNSGKAMGDDHCGTVFHKSLESLLHKTLALCVKRRCRLVEDKDRWILKNGPGYADPLALSA